MAFDFSTFGQPEQTTQQPVKKTTGFNFETFGQEAEPEQKKGFLEKYLFPTTSEFINYVSKGALVQSGTFQDLLDARQRMLESEAALRKSIPTQKDAAIREKQQKILENAAKARAEVEARINDVTGTKAMTPGQIAGTALGVALEATLPIDIAAGATKGLASKLIPTSPLLKEVAALGLGDTALGKAVNSVERLTSFKPMTQAERIAYKAAPFTSKLQTIGKDVLKVLPESVGYGYGFDVAGNLQQGKTGQEAFVPGVGTGIGIAVPVSIGAARSLMIPVSNIFRTVQSFGKPSEEMILTEQRGLQQAYEDVFKQRESTYIKDEFFKKQGKNPSETLAKYGLVPDTEYVNGKTVLRTQETADTATTMIGKRAEGIQNSLDRIAAQLPNAVAKTSEMRDEALQIAKTKFSGQELISQENKLKNIFKGLEKKYGDEIDVGSINRERIAANKMTRAYDRPQFEKDAFSVTGDIFRRQIDNLISDPIVRKVNSEIGDLIAAREMLTKLNGKNVGGGRFTNIIASAAGAMLGQMAAKDAGIFNQAIYAIATMTGIRLFLKVLAGNAFGGAATRRILSALVDDPALLNALLEKEPMIIQKGILEDIIRTLKETPLLEAPKAGAKRSEIGSGEVMKVIPKGSQIEPTGKGTIAGESSLAKNVYEKVETQSPKTNLPTTKQIKNNTKNVNIEKEGTSKNIISQKKKKVNNSKK